MITEEERICREAKVKQEEVDYILQGLLENVFNHIAPSDAINSSINVPVDEDTDEKRSSTDANEDSIDAPVNEDTDEKRDSVESDMKRNIVLDILEELLESAVIHIPSVPVMETPAEEIVSGDNFAILDWCKN
jgi:hypothetical protein